MTATVPEGFRITTTGGGCTAWKGAAPSGAGVLITDAETMLAPQDDMTEYAVGCYAPGWGDLIDMANVATLAAALAWVATR